MQSIKDGVDVEGFKSTSFSERAGLVADLNRLDLTRLTHTSRRILSTLTSQL